MPEEIRYSIENGLARITLDRPPLNVLTLDMLERLAAALDRASTAGDVRLVRLDAVGKCFSAGVDVADHVEPKVERMIERLVALFESFARVPVPIVALAQGAALGGGLEVILGADLCFASERANFGQPEIRLGLFAPPASVLLPRLIGERRALGLLLSGETIPAAEAARIGLVNEVFADDRFDAECDSRLARMLALSGPALRLAKRAVVESRERPVAQAHRAVARLYLDEMMVTADAREGLASFLEKRPPVWRHR